MQIVIKQFFTLLAVTTFSFSASAYVRAASSNSLRIYALKYQDQSGRPMVSFFAQCGKFRNEGGYPVKYFETCHSYGNYEQAVVDNYLASAGIDMNFVEEKIKILSEKNDEASDQQDALLLSLLGGPATFTAAWLFSFGSSADYLAKESELIKKSNAVALLVGSSDKIGVYVHIKEFEKKLISELTEIYNLSRQP